jgi:hypothetical protein
MCPLHTEKWELGRYSRNRYPAHNYILTDAVSAYALSDRVRLWV